MAKKSASTTTPSATMGLSAKQDEKLALIAQRKLLINETPTKAEREALRRFEKLEGEKGRWEIYKSIPQKHWREMSGRQTKTLREQATNYGIPFDRAVISLPDVVKALHDFFAANARKLAAKDKSDDDLWTGDTESPALERYREERALLARLDRLEREGELIPRDEIRSGLGLVASILKQAGDTLQRQFGEEAAEILIEAIEDAEREIKRLAPSEEDEE